MAVLPQKSASEHMDKPIAIVVDTNLISGEAKQDLPDIVSQRLTDLDRRLSQLEKAAQGDIPPTAAQIAARQRK